MVSGSFAPKLLANFKEINSFSVVPSLNLELEYANSAVSAWFVRTILAYDSNAGLMQYSYIGFGKRYYWKGAAYDYSAGDQVGQITSDAKTRIFFGLDFGFSQSVVATVGSILQANTGNIDYGFHAGFSRAFSRSLSLNLQFGYSMAMAFSGYSANGSTMKMLIGFAKTL